MSQTTCESMMNSPIGRVWIAATERGITGMEIAKGRRARAGGARPTGAPQRKARTHVTQAIRQLREYFAGRRQEFALPLDLQGTPLQQSVWRNLLEIPYGQTLTYGEVARRVGTPKAARAVGAACGANPVWLVVPCHRVVGSDGSLHGYGGGLWRKEYLLKLEGAMREERRAKNENRTAENGKQRELFQ